MKRKPLSNRDGEVRELTRKDLRQFRPAGEVLPGDLAALLPKRKPGQRGPQKKPTKDQITLRLDRDVVAHYKATGRRWQSRINADLREAIKRTG
jgi:uncharacterized protein (DUF4415 family)